jgi:hypothetical protein
VRPTNWCQPRGSRNTCTHAAGPAAPSTQQPGEPGCTRHSGGRQARQPCRACMPARWLRTRHAQAASKGFVLAQYQVEAQHDSSLPAAGLRHESSSYNLMHHTSIRGGACAFLFANQQDRCAGQGSRPFLECMHSSSDSSQSCRQQQEQHKHTAHARAAEGTVATPQRWCHRCPSEADRQWSLHALQAAAAAAKPWLLGLRLVLGSPSSLHQYHDVHSNTRLRGSDTKPQLNIHALPLPRSLMPHTPLTPAQLPTAKAGRAAGQQSSRAAAM